MTNLSQLAGDMKAAMQRERLEEFNARKGWEHPPDAGDSTLGAWGIQNPMTLWLLRQAPELLEWTPKQLVAGLLNPPSCPKPNCRGPMALKVAPAVGRLPRRWVWACHKPIRDGSGRQSKYGGYTDCGGRREFTMYKAQPVARDEEQRPLGLRTLLRWTQEGASIEYQPDEYGEKRAIKVERHSEKNPPRDQGEKLRTRRTAAGRSPLGLP